MFNKANEKKKNDSNIIYNSEEKILSNTPYNPFNSDNSSPKIKDVISIDTPNNTEEEISINQENLNDSNERAQLKADLTNKEDNTKEDDKEKDDQIPPPKDTEDLFDLVNKNKKQENTKTWFNRDGRKEKDEYEENNLKKIMKDYEKISKFKKDTSISISELESIQFNMYYVKVYSKEEPILLKDKLRPRIKFENLKHVPNQLLQNLKLLQYEYLTPVQRVIMPYIQYGKDIVCVTETGSGKTLSYLFSILGQMLIEGVPDNPYLKKREEQNNQENKNNDFKDVVAYPICLIVVPSRELASQISKECKLLAQNTGVKTVEIIGGDKRVHQLIDLSKGCDILIGTPWRLQQYLNSGKIDLKLVKFLVLDEADKMLSFEFYYQLKEIFDKLPKKKFRQNLLFSATFNEDVKGIAYYCLNNYYYFNSVKECPKTIKQKFFYCKDTNEKFEHLINYLNELENKNKSILIFVNNKKGVDEMMKIFQDENIQACSIHGHKSQADRNKSLRDFSLCYKKILVSTDLLSRGLDFPNLHCVINFDVPYTIEDYIHRIGRTGRLGQKGLAITYLDRIDDTNKENLINLLNSLGEEVPSWINEVEYQTRYNLQDQKKEVYYRKKVNQKSNEEDGWNDNTNNNFNNDFRNNRMKRNNNDWNNNKRKNFNINSNNNFKRNDKNHNFNINNNYNNNYGKEGRIRNDNRNSNDINFNRNNSNTNNKYYKNQNDNWDNTNNQNNNDFWNNNSNNNDNWNDNDNNDNWNDNSNNNQNNNDNWNDNNNDNWNDNSNNNQNNNDNWNDNSKNNQNNNDNWNNDYKDNNNEIPEDVFEELFIRGINYKSEENDLRNTFSKYGEIVRCKILKDKETNKSIGIGFVKFKEKYQAYNAMKDKENIECHGRKLKIKYSNERNKENNNGDRNNNIHNNKNKIFENKRNNNFINNKNKKENNDDDGWNEKTKERERSREKEINNEDIDAW